LKNVLTNDVTTIEDDGTEEIGSVEITASNLVEDTSATLTVTDVLTMDFNTLYSEKGAAIDMPLTADVNNAATWDLVITEALEDGSIDAGETVTLELGFDAADEPSVGDAATLDGDNTLSGGNMLQTASSSKLWVGYIASDLASKIDLDASADQYTAEVTYYGGQVYGNVYVTGAGATTGSTSWTAVKDSETSVYTSKHVIAIGGTAVNKVARKMLGLTDLETPVYGSDSVWATATGVNAIGKGILWIKPNVYTTGKYAMLVAGYEGADTEKVANFLTISGTTLAKEKAVLNTAGTAVVEATA